MAHLQPANRFHRFVRGEELDGADITFAALQCLLEIRKGLLLSHHQQDIEQADLVVQGCDGGNLKVFVVMYILLTHENYIHTYNNTRSIVTIIECIYEV